MKRYTAILGTFMLACYIYEAVIKKTETLSFGYIYNYIYYAISFFLGTI